MAVNLHRNCLVVFCLVVWHLTISAQVPPNARELFLADSLKKVFTKSGSDSSKLRIQYLIQTYLHNTRVSYWDSFAVAANHAGAAAPECWALQNSAFYNSPLNKNAAIETSNKGILIAQKNDLQPELCLLFHNLASIYYQMQNTTKALEYSFKSLRLAEKLKDSAQMISCYNLIGLLYLSSGDIKKALGIHLNCLELSKKIGDRTSTSLMLCNIGSDYAHLYDHKNAAYYYIQSLTYVDTVNDKPKAFTIFNSVGSAYQMKKQYDSADYFYNRAFRIALKYKQKAPIASVLCQLASCNLEKGNFSVAKKQALEALSLAQSVNFMAQVVPLADQLSQIYTKENNFKQALYYYKLFTSTKDSIKNESNQKQVLEKEFNYNLEKKENENKLLLQKTEIQALQLDKNRYLVYGLVASVILLFIIGLLLLRQNKLKSERQSIQMQQKLLRSQMDPHFIFNALNSINQFILSKENEKAQSYLTRFSTLLRRLLESSTNEVISIREEIIILEKYLEIEAMRFSNVFNYKISVAENCNTTKTDIPHFLVQPFVENAIWHGLLPKKGDKNINILFEQKMVGTITCTIEDDGVGRLEKTEDQLKNNKLSLAITFIKQRLEILGKLKKVKCGVEIIDKKDANGNAIGTKVIVTIPVMSQI